MSRPPVVTTNLTRLGFDVSRLGFGLRTALAASLALVLAWLIGLEHPQWSAMTVWAVSQPVRGMLIEKSIFRALGTLVGTLFGVFLVLLTEDNLPLMVLGLSLWIGLCVGVGNLLRGLISYGALLSGYSATMVALLNTQPDSQVFLLGTDRLLTVLTGVVVGSVVGLLFTPQGAEEQLTGRVRRNTSDILQAMATRFAGKTTPNLVDAAHQLLASVAATEQLFDTHAAGSLRSHLNIRALRALSQAQVAACYWIRSSQNLPPDQAMASALEQVAQALRINAPAQQVLSALKDALALCSDRATARVLRQLLDSQREHLSTADEHGEIPLIRNRVVLHRDWIGARHATLRAVSLLLLIGAGWILTGWEAGAYVMLGTSVMITLFSTFDTPSKIMSHILLWQCVAAVAALSCHWLIWPLLSAEWQLIATLSLFTLLIIPFMAHPRFASGSLDYVMTLLLLSHPVYPLATSFTESLSIAAAVVSCPLLAYIAFRIAWPADARRRRKHLTQMMFNELNNMANTPLSPTREFVWRARLCHRLLKLIQSVGASADVLPSVTSGGLAVLAIGDAIQQLHSLQQEPGQTVGLSRQANVTLLRLQQLAEAPQKAALSLRRLANQLARSGHPAAWDMENAARGIAANIQFFQKT